jgi:hypothetical protein
LTRLRSLSYIGACVLLAACPGPPGPLVPVPLSPVARDSAIRWTRTTLPRTPTLIRFRWRYEDEHVKYAGRGTARIAPPDSMRFDYAGPLGLGSGAAVVIGDSVLWADPEKNFRALVPAIRMLWAAFGMVRPPAGAEISGAQLVDAASQRRRGVWRFADAPDTLEYLATDSAGRATLLEAEWRRGGERVARSRAQLDTARRPASARIDFFAGAGTGRTAGRARFELTVGMVDTAAVMAPALWRSRR